MSGDEQKEKAITLIMLQPTTPARESPAWTHVPSQPLTRSPLSRFQTPTDTSQCGWFFRVWQYWRVTSPSGSHSLLWNRQLIGSQPFRPSTPRILIQKHALSVPGVGGPCIPPRGRATATFFAVRTLRYAFGMPDGEITESGERASGSWWRTPLLYLRARLQQREDQVFLVLALVIGALTGLAVVAFILLTERAGMRLYPLGSARWRRLLLPVGGSLGIGYLLYRYFPDARGSGVPQTKAALYARGGRITMRTVIGKFFCTSATLASGIPLGREGPSV